MINERRNIKVFYSIPIVSEGVKKVTATYAGDDVSGQGATKELQGLAIKGIAIEAGVSRNKIRYQPEELAASAASMIGKPIITDHRAEVRNIVGYITAAHYDAKAQNVPFEGLVLDSLIQTMVEDKRIKNVSVGAGVDELVEEEIDGEVAQTAKGISHDELSFVVIPGVRAASLTQALTEKYEQVIRVAEMAKTREADGEDPKDAKIAKLEAEIADLKKKNEKAKEADDEKPEDKKKDDKKEESVSPEILEMRKKLEESTKALEASSKLQEEFKKLLTEKVQATTPAAKTEEQAAKQSNFVHLKETKSFYAMPDSKGNWQRAE